MLARFSAEREGSDSAFEMKEFRMAKQYILVDKNSYERMVEGGKKSYVNHSRSKINPFQNPDVTRAKTDRQKMLHLVNSNRDENKPLEETNDLLRELINKYRTSYNRVTRQGKRKAKTDENTLPKQLRIDANNQPLDNRTQHHLPSGGATHRRMSSVSVEGATKSRRRSSSYPESDTLSYTQDDVIDMIGGYVSKTDLPKTAKLIDEMRKAGVSVRGSRVYPVKIGESTITPGQMKTFIRDATINSPDRRQLNPTHFEHIREYLEEKNVKFPIESSFTRRSARTNQKRRLGDYLYHEEDYDESDDFQLEDDE